MESRLSRDWIFRTIYEQSERDFEGYNNPQEIPPIDDRVLYCGSGIIDVEGCVRGYLHGGTHHENAYPPNTSHKNVIREETIIFIVAVV